VLKNIILVSILHIIFITRNRCTVIGLVYCLRLLYLYLYFSWQINSAAALFFSCVQELEKLLD